MSKAIAGIVGGGNAPKKMKEAPLPPVEAPQPMPDEEAIKRAKMRAAVLRRRGGRADTIMTDEDDLGG
jgi:hypothetical protein